MNPFEHLTRAMSTTVLATFGEPVVFFMEDGTQIKGQGVFSAVYQEASVRPGGQASTGIGVSTVQPVLEVVATHLPAQPTEGDEVGVRGLRYLIVDAQPDGHGFLRLFLHKNGVMAEEEDDEESNPPPEDEDP